MRRAFPLLLLAACGGGDDDDGGATTLHVTATATATMGTERVDCDFTVELTSIVADDGGFTADSAGEVFRRSFRDDSILFEFSALIAGPMSLTETAGGVEVRLAGDQPDDAMPFWDELEVLDGAASGADTYEGTWTCAPILPGDPDTEDLEFDAPGTWSIAP